MSPKGFLASGWNVGIKDETLDFGVIFSQTPATAAAVFTKNNFPGNPVIVGRENVQNGRLQAIVVNSKNANVATGPDGLEAARNTCRWAAEALGISPELVLPSSTGVIGRPMPVEKIQAACASIPDRIKTGDFDLFSRAIMTTDTFPKIKTESLSSGIVVTGCAKGAGMIAPDMATMLSYVCTDAQMDPADLRRLVQCITERTFNRVSVDSDTSTSDTFVCLANGASGVRVSFPAAAGASWAASAMPVPGDLPGLDNVSKEFALAVGRICLFLAKEVARDGEGATKLIEVQVKDARSKEQALKIARSIINSPLVKTAVYGADPNWGRLVMAVGKVFDEPVPIESMQIHFGDKALKNAGEKELKAISVYLKGKEILITVSLGLGSAVETMWGCDLTEGYVEVNAHYTT